jgi:hypothetical protein
MLGGALARRRAPRIVTVVSTGWTCFWQLTRSAGNRGSLTRIRAASVGPHPADRRSGEGRHSMLARRRAGAGQGLLRGIPDACLHRIGQCGFVSIEGGLA